MIAHIDIENSHTQDVETLDLVVNEYIEDEIVKFDISDLDEEQLEMLKLAISTEKDTRYTDIEMFFIDDDNIPEFGPDYHFYIENNELIGQYIKKIYKRKEV
jgi:hypothetical protein